MFFIILYLVMFLAQLFHNFYTTLTTFFEDQSLNIYGPHIKKTNLMVDHKKKKEKE
jgi:hypothetical protein